MGRTFKVHQGFEYRVYPNRANREYFHQCFGCTRKMYNLRVEQIHDEQQAYHDYKAQHAGSPAGFKYDWVTEKQAKQAYPYLKEADSLALVNARRDFETAFKRYTQGKANKPHYRSKMTYPRTFRTSNLSTSSGDTIYIFARTRIVTPDTACTYPRLVNMAVMFLSWCIVMLTGASST